MRRRSQARDSFAAVRYAVDTGAMPPPRRRSFLARQKRVVLPVVAVMLSSLFGFLYVLLGLETYSLLIGAVALFIVVSALMVLTQMVKWPVRSLASAPQV